MAIVSRWFERSELAHRVAHTGGTAGYRVEFQTLGEGMLKVVEVETRWWVDLSRALDGMLVPGVDEGSCPEVDGHKLL